MVQKIILGPITGLHTGIHDSLYRSPPKDCCYQQQPCQHIFPFNNSYDLPDEPSPFIHFHSGEYYDFGKGEEIVHSITYPVLGRHAWVSDISDFADLALGRVVMNPDIRNALSGNLSESLFFDMRNRIECLTTAFLNPSCLAVTLCSEGSRRKTLNWLDNFGLEKIALQFEKKCEVVYPAQQILLRRLVSSKWHASNTLEIVFCGRSFKGKNGEIVLRLFDILAKDFETVKLTYIGDIPTDKKRKYPFLFSKMNHFESIERKQVLEIFARSHILFHPAPRECFGMVYCEAAAAGMAVVTGNDGGRNLHGREILGKKGALYGDFRKSNPKTIEKKFLDCLIALLSKRELAYDIGMNNYRRATNGKLSILRRNQDLQSIYECATKHSSKYELTVDDLPLKGDEKLIAATSQELAVECRNIRQKTDFHDLNIYIG